MLTNIRENSQGAIAKIILGLVILTFAIAGVGSYTNSVDTSVAEVNGEKISQQAYNQAYQAQRRRMQQQFGEMFDTLAANKDYMANFRNGVLDNLINEKLIDQNANDLSIRVSDQQLKKTIRNMSEFQIDGVFDNNRYLAVINQSGFFQSSDFRDYLRTEIKRRQLTQAIASTEFSLPYQENLVQKLQDQHRDIRVAKIAAEQFKKTVSVSEDEIKSYYQANQHRFENKEQVKVDYITLNVNDISKGIKATEKDISTYYQDNINKYTQPEQRRIAHILIEFGDDEAAAKKKAETILAKIKQGEDFAKLAKTDSADTLSGESGGDLEWLEKGAIDEAFDKVAFALTKVGQVSDVVKSSFGFHLIKLTDLKAATVKPLSEVHDKVATKLAKEKAQDKFFELQQKLAEVSYEVPDNLDDAASSINGKVVTSVWLKRSGNTAPFDNKKVTDAVFSDVVLKEGLNSDVVEVNDNLAMVLRLNEYQEAKVKPLTEVSALIRATLITDKASTQAQLKAQELLTALKTNKGVEELLTELNTQFDVKANVARQGSAVNVAISRAAFVLPHPVEGKIVASTITLANGDLAVVELQAVTAGNTKEDTNLAKQLASQLAQSAYQNYINSLKSDAKITRHTVKAPAAGY
ncbi:MAG: SurA N-terminal domain-containing protein [Alteromonadaceae bacterium]|nr:SurA N-terminal domain-containing protein [Alteromonadaceae bacterium]